MIFDHLYFSFVKSVFIFFAQFWIGISFFFSDFIRTLKNILFYAVICCHILHFYLTFQLYYALLTQNLLNFWKSFLWVFFEMIKMIFTYYIVIIVFLWFNFLMAIFFTIPFDIADTLIYCGGRNQTYFFFQPLEYSKIISQWFDMSPSS